MEWWQRMMVPLKRALAAMASRVRAKKDAGRRGNILVVLCDEVQSCGYEDVKVMWEMLQISSGAELARAPSKKKKEKMHRRWRRAACTV